MTDQDKTQEKEQEQKQTTEQPKTQPSKVTDALLDKGAKSVGDQLKKQKKVKVKLHLPTEDRQKLEAAVQAGKKVNWPYETVNINGYSFQIQRGKEVEVPQSVYDVLSQANII